MTTQVLLAFAAATAAGLVVGVLLRVPPVRARLGTGRSGAAWPAGIVGPWLRPNGTGSGAVLAGAALLAGAVGWVAARSVVLAALGAGAVLLAARGWRERRRGRAAEVTAEEVLGLLAAAVAELRAGQPLPAALSAAAVDRGELGPGVLRACQPGADTAGHLRELAGRPGAAGLGYLAACVQVGERSGGALVEALSRLEWALRAEQARRLQARASLAGPMASAALLAVLPLVGLLLGSALGTGPVRLLLHSPLGQLSLLAAAGLDLLGLVWVRRIVGSAG